MSLINLLVRVKQPSAKRVGRGIGSGQGGHTSGRGSKGHRAREGKAIPLWFEGGQLPLVKRLPWWRGKGRLKSLNTYQEVQLSAVIKSGLTEVNPASLLKAKLIRSAAVPVRLIGVVTVASVLKVTGVAATAPVAQAITKAGGEVTL
jgi:large subunit ribosomal protein L15